MTVFLFSSRPICGSPFTREPVEMTTAFLASCFSSLPSAVFTLTAFLPVSFAVPLIHVILFFLKRNSTPLEFCVLTARERFIATPKSSFTSPGVTPNSGAFFIFSAIDAASSSALAGMQPQMHAGAAEPFALDDGGVEAELGGADRAHVAGGAAADEDHVEAMAMVSTRA